MVRRQRRFQARAGRRFLQQSSDTSPGAGLGRPKNNRSRAEAPLDRSNRGRVRRAWPPMSSIVSWRGGAAAHWEILPNRLLERVEA
jgi:hypothetical protein